MRAEQIPAALKFANRLVDEINKIAPRLTLEERYRDGQRIIDELDMELRELGMSKVAERLPRLSFGSRVRQTYDALIEVLKELLSDVSSSLTEPHKGKSTAKRRRRGPPIVHNASDDRKIVRVWKTGRYKHYADLESELQLPPDTVKKSIDRDRHR